MADPRVVPEVGLGLLDKSLGVNGRATSGLAMSAIANQLYMMYMRRLHVFYSKHAGIGASFASGIVHRTQFNAGNANAAGGVWMTVTYSDSGTTGNAGLATLNVSGVSELSSFPDPANTAVAATGPSNFRSATFRLNNTGGANVTVDWSVDANSAINGVIIYGLPVGISNTYAALLPRDAFLVGNPVTGDSIDVLDVNLRGLFNGEGTVHFAWSGTASQTGATYANILDAATTGYAASAAGFWTIPEKQATLTGTTVRCNFWCYASSTGTTGRVRIQNSTGVLGTITGIGAANYYNLDINLDPTLTRDLVIVECSEATGGQTVTVTGAGLYSYDTI